MKPFAARTAEAFSAIHELNFALQSGKSAAVAEEVKGKGNWSSEIHKKNSAKRRQEILRFGSVIDLSFVVS